MEVETVEVKRREGVLVLTGDFTVHVEAHSYRAHEGDLVLIPPNPCTRYTTTRTPT